MCYIGCAKTWCRDGVMKFYPQRGSLMPLKLVDGGFKHCQYSSNPAIPTSYSKYIIWDRDVSEEEDVVFYTDDDILKPQPNHRVRVAWLSEPYCKQPFIYNWVAQNHHQYDYILTNEKLLLDIGEKFLFYPLCGNWIEQASRKVDHKKTKLVSIITSDKNREGTDHWKRHEIIKKYGDKIDVMGNGYKPIELIQTGLIDYMFNFAMENQARDYHFSEKIINPFMVGTIPIYYGPDCIGDYFDTRGMIIFKEVSDVEDVLKEISPKLYQSMLPYVKENFKIVTEKYNMIEDWMYENGVFEKVGAI